MQQVQRGTHVVEIVFQWVGNGFTHVAVRGEVHHDVNLLGPQHAFHRLLVSQVNLVKGGRRGNRAAMAVDEVIHDNRSMTGSDKLANTMAADVTGASYNENIH